MKRMIVYGLAIVLVTVALPTLAHQAAYPEECDDRVDLNRCQKDQGREPAHKRCAGDRNAMTGDGSEDENIIARRSLGIAGAPESLKAYVYASDDTTQNEATGLPMPGLVWIEDNGFNGLQRTDWECQSDGHDDPKKYEVHADKVLI